MTTPSLEQRAAEAMRDAFVSMIARQDKIPIERIPVTPPAQEGDRRPAEEPLVRAMEQTRN